MNKEYKEKDKTTHKAKKSLGQNFLKSNQALREIIKTGEIKKEDIILEIGPGKGALTEKLLENSNHVIAIEKDRDLIEFLKEKFQKEITEKKLTVIEGDVLGLDLGKQNILGGTLGSRDGDGQRKFEASNFRGESENILLNYKIIANIPYNITGAILKKFLTEENQPELMVLMVQHEVAKRIVARDNKESILSISVKAYGTPSIIMKVPARYFSPAPRVDSAIIKISDISRKLFLKYEKAGGGVASALIKIDEVKFWHIVKSGFAHKRKVLIKNLENTLYTKQQLLEVFKKLKISEKTRAEDLSLDDWIEITKLL